MRKAFIIRMLELHTKPTRVLTETFEHAMIKRETEFFYIMADGRRIKKSTVVFFKEVK